MRCGIDYAVTMASLNDKSTTWILNRVGGGSFRGKEVLHVNYRTCDEIPAPRKVHPCRLSLNPPRLPKSLQTSVPATHFATCQRGAKFIPTFWPLMMRTPLFVGATFSIFPERSTMEKHGVSRNSFLPARLPHVSHLCCDIFFCVALTASV